VGGTVAPTDASVVTNYTFYVKATAQGGSEHFFGPYVLHVNCSSYGLGTWSDAAQNKSFEGRPADGFVLPEYSPSDP
jgi:hypothetical protein